MYMPPQFTAKDDAQAARLMRDYPFASLISCDDDGVPYITELPLHLEWPDAQALPVLLGHVAKPNPHWRYLQSRADAVVTFMGPQAYMSPRVYPDLVRVPTWSYLAVHCKVQCALIDEPTAKDHLLKKLIGDHDPAYANQWIDLGIEYQHKMLAGIVAFELRVTHLQCKIKLNQHRPESHAAMYKAYSAGNDNERALAAWMQALGMVNVSE